MALSSSGSCSSTGLVSFCSSPSPCYYGYGTPLMAHRPFFPEFGVGAGGGSSCTPSSSSSSPDYTPSTPSCRAASADYTPSTPSSRAASPDYTLSTPSSVEDYTPSSPDYSPSTPSSRAARADYTPSTPLSRAASEDYTPSTPSYCRAGSPDYTPSSPPPSAPLVSDAESSTSPRPRRHHPYQRSGASTCSSRASWISRRGQHHRAFLH